MEGWEKDGLCSRARGRGGRWFQLYGGLPSTALPSSGEALAQAARVHTEAVCSIPAELRLGMGL